MLPTTHIMGLGVRRVTERQAVETIAEGAAAGRGGRVITPNLDQLRRHTTDPAVRGYFGDAELVVADGMPLVWASRVIGDPLPERVAGSDLIRSLSAEAAARGLSVFLLGGDPGAADAARDRLQAEFPALRVAGVRCPPPGFERDEAELAAMADQLERAAPAIVFVGLGFPKQEALIDWLRPRLPHAWFLGIGIGFSFLSGDVRRAPGWMQRSGLEWLHRLVQEPSRLYDRYVRDGLPFAARLLLWSLLARERA